MSSKLLIVGSRRDQPGEDRNLDNYRNYFQKTLGESWLVNSALLDDLLFDISSDNFSVFDLVNRLELFDYSFILLRGKLRGDLDVAMAICAYAQKNGIKFANEYRSLHTSSKLAQAVKFHLAG